MNRFENAGKSLGTKRYNVDKTLKKLAIPKIVTILK